MTRPAPTATQSQIVLLLVAALRLAMGLGINILLARLLAPADFGFIVFISVVITVVNELADFGTNNVAAREIARDRSRERAILESLIAWRFLAGSVLAVAILPFALLEHDPHRRALLLATAAMLPVLAPGGLYPAFQVRQRQGKPAIATAISYLLLLLGVLFFIRLGVRGVSFGWLILGREIIYVIGLTYFGIGLLGYFPKPGFIGRGFKILLGMSALYGGAALVHNLYFYADVFLVKIIRGESELGAYAAAFRLINPLMILPWILVVPLVPVLSARFGNSRKSLEDLSADAIAMAAGIGCIAAAAGTIVAPDLIALVYGGRFTSGALSAVTAFRWLAAALGIVLVTPVAVSALLALNRERFLLFLSSVGFIINLAGNLIVLPRFGFTAAAVVTALTEFAVCIGALICLSRMFRSSVLRAAHIPLLLPGAGVAIALYYLSGSAIFRVAAAIGLCAAASAVVLASPVARRHRKSLARDGQDVSAEAPALDATVSSACNT